MSSDVVGMHSSFALNTWCGALDLGAFCEYPCGWEVRNVPLLKIGTAAGTGIGDDTWHVPVRCGGMACCARRDADGACGGGCQRRGDWLHDLGTAAGEHDGDRCTGISHRCV